MGKLLMYLPDPVSALQRVAHALRPGGIVVCQEMDTTMTPARTAPYPLHDRVNGWIWSTVAGEGANVRMGMQLPGCLAACGLSVEHVRAEAEIEGHTDSMATIVRAILPRLLRHADVTEDEIDIETLDERLVRERVQAGGVYIRHMTFGVWARRT